MSEYKGVTFGNKHTSVYGLVLSRKTIESPQPKLATVDIPGGDGALDYTEYFGDVKYKNRKLKFELSTDKVNAPLLTLYTNVQNDLLGKHFDSIVLDDDPNYRYIGRVTSVSLASGDINRIVIECSCEPYKVGVNNTVVNVPLNSYNFPDGYGNINQDNIVDERDTVLLTKIIGYESHSVPEMQRCDLDRNGVVAQNDFTLLNRAIANADNTSLAAFIDYADNNFNLARDTSREVNFGRKVITAVFAMPANVGTWKLYIDDVLYATEQLPNLSILISGTHTVKVVTTVSGNMTISYPQTKL